MTTFERVKELCDERKMSINDLEDALGYSKNTLYRLKTQNPGGDKLIALADYLNTSTDYLLCRTDNKYWVPAEKEAHDTALELEKMIKGLKADADLKFYGEAINTEDKAKLAIALKLSLEINKQEMEGKFTT